MPLMSALSPCRSFLRGPAGLLFPAALLLLAGLLATPARAQVVAEFWKNDCDSFNNFCQEPSPEAGNCDSVLPPMRPFIPNRRSSVGGLVRYVLTIRNGDTARSGLELTDLLPPCTQLSCAGLCSDTNCNGEPDSGPVTVTFSGGGSHGPVTCDPAANSLRISNIALGPDEEMEVRFCARFTTEGFCCNRATLRDPLSGQEQLAMDWYSQWTALEPDVCVDVTPPVFWKDDCGPRTGDPADCDDALTDDVRLERYVVPPAEGRRVMWVLHYHAPPDAPGENIVLYDNVPMDQTVACNALPGGWGCFQVLLNGTDVTDMMSDQCTPGPGGGVQSTRTVPIGSRLEVRFCVTLNDAIGQRTCNEDSRVRFGDGGGMSIQIPFVDNLSGELGRACLRGNPPQVTATKILGNAATGPFGPGDTVEYVIDICETTGIGPATVNFSDPIPTNITAPAIVAAPGVCSLVAGPPQRVQCTGLVVPASGCRQVRWQGTVTCDGLQDGSLICNQGTMTITDPPDSVPIPTDDPGDPTSNRDPTCFPIALDRATGTKDVQRVAPPGQPDCGQVVTMRYSVVVGSTGSRTAGTVVLEDVIDADATYVPGSARLDGAPVADNFNPGPPATISIVLGDMPIGTTRTVTFDVTATAVAGGTTLSNQGILLTADGMSCGYTAVTSDATRLGQGIAFQPTVTVVDCEAPEIASVSKSVAPDEGFPGSTITYTVGWCNTGDGPATNVRFRDVLDDCLDPLPLGTRLNGTAVPDPFACGAAPRSLCFLADASQAPGECHEVQIDALVRDDDPVACPPGTVIPNVASVESDQTGSQSSPVGAATFTILASEPQFSLSKQLTTPPPPASPAPGEQVTWTVTWCNTGDGPATDVRFEDQLDACTTHVETRLGPDDGSPGTPVADPFDPACSTGPGHLCFTAAATQAPSECLKVEVDVLVVDDSVACPNARIVANIGRVSSAEGVSAQDSASFAIGGAVYDLRRMEVSSLRPLNPPKGPTSWGDVDAIGACDASQPRIQTPGNPVDFPSCTCLPGEGEAGTPGAPLILWEVAGGDCQTLFVERVDCTGDGTMDIRIRFEANPGDGC